MNKNYEVEIVTEDNTTYLSVTHNSTTWTSLRILDAAYEIPLIMDVLRCHLSSKHSGRDSIDDGWICNKCGTFHSKVMCSNCGTSHR